ncbi:hypothetical protein ACE6H2_015923 [Prunus campanulata]
MPRHAKLPIASLSRNALNGAMPRPRHAKARQGKARHGKATQGVQRPRHDMPRQGKACQGMTSQGFQKFCRQIEHAARTLPTCCAQASCMMRAGCRHAKLPIASLSRNALNREQCQGMASHAIPSFQ